MIYKPPHRGGKNRTILKPDERFPGNEGVSLSDCGAFNRKDNGIPCMIVLDRPINKRINKRL